MYLGWAILRRGQIREDFADERQAVEESETAAADPWVGRVGAVPRLCTISRCAVGLRRLPPIYCII